MWKSSLKRTISRGTDDSAVNDEEQPRLIPPIAAVKTARSSPLRGALGAAPPLSPGVTEPSPCSSDTLRQCSTRPQRVRTCLSSLTPDIHFQKMRGSVKVRRSTGARRCLRRGEARLPNDRARIKRQNPARGGAATASGRRVERAHERAKLSL